MNQSDDEAWMSRAQQLRAVRLIEYGAKYHKLRGLRRWIRLAALHAGCGIVSVHRKAWLLGLLKQ